MQNPPLRTDRRLATSDASSFPRFRDLVDALAGSPRPKLLSGTPRDAPEGHWRHRRRATNELTPPDSERERNRSSNDKNSARARELSSDSRATRLAVAGRALLQRLATYLQIPIALAPVDHQLRKL